MALNLTSGEGLALYRLLAESTSDIVLKTDTEGRIVDASASLERAGFQIRGTLAGTHLLDLVAPDGKVGVMREHAQAVAGADTG